MNDFPLKLDIRIDWSEVDLFGHVNNLAILKYIQASRVNYLEQVGLMKSQAEKKLGPVLASINCQYRKPLFFPGQVTVCSRIAWINNTSFGMQHRVYNEQKELAAEAEDVIVFYDFHHKVKMSVSDEFRGKIERLEKRRILSKVTVSG